MFFVFLILGLLIGSFLNVVIDRLPRNESIIKGRSYCEYCKKQLVWHDLIPLLSFIYLSGRCRYCKHKLSYFYPTLEGLTAFLYVFVYLWAVNQLGNHLYTLSGLVFLIFYLFVFSSFIVIFFVDLKYGIILDKILILDVVIAFLYLFAVSPSQLPQHIFSGVFLFLSFLLLFYITKQKGIGFGDVKLVFYLGLLLGFPLVIY